MAYQRESPDYSENVAKVASAFPAQWEAARKRPDGTRDHAFIRLLASVLHYGSRQLGIEADPKVGLNGKRGGAEESADALAYLNASGPGGVEVIDVIIGATHSPAWQDATIPPMPHPQGKPEVPGGVLGRFIQPARLDAPPQPPAPPLPIPAPVPQPPAGPAHPYGVHTPLGAEIGGILGVEGSPYLGNARAIGEATAHLIWKVQYEGYSLDAAKENARKRSKGEAAD